MSTLLAPHRNSTAADLLRVAAVWLALILGLQGIAAAQALGLGPLHLHRQTAPVLPHTHHHVDAERHHHAALDDSVMAAADEGAFDAVAFALAAALALMALAVTRASPDARRTVWRAAPAWAWRVHRPPILRKPPRLG